MFKTAFGKSHSITSYVSNNIILLRHSIHSCIFWKYLGKLFERTKQSTKIMNTFICLWSAKGHWDVRCVYTQRLITDFFLKKLGFFETALTNYFTFPLHLIFYHLLLKSVTRSFNFAT